MKDDKTVIEEFNKMVNMTAAELKKWLETSESRNVGWSTDEGSGESVGHDSGRKIVEILESNPTKDSSKYSVEQLQHMKKVVSYCKRHLAQEERIHDSKSAEEVKKTKSYASLKNWGHDPLKDDQSSDQASDTDDKNSGSPHRKQPGTKRDALNTASEGHNKRLKTEKETSNSDQKSLETGSNTSPENPSAHSDSDENSPDSRNEDEGSRGAKAGTSDTSQTKNESGKSPKVGEKVSWNWGRGQPEGKVIDVTDQKKTITTKKGNQVSRKGDAKDPAVTIDTGKSTAIKLAHELND